MGNYLLMDEGWRGYKRLHHVWAHLATTDGKFYVHEDGTEEGIANRLLDAGVPKERIVLAMDAPNSRDESVSAVACVARAHQRIGVMEAKAASQYQSCRQCIIMPRRETVYYALDRAACGGAGGTRSEC